MAVQQGGVPGGGPAHSVDINTSAEVEHHDSSYKDSIVNEWSESFSDVLMEKQPFKNILIFKFVGILLTDTCWSHL